MLYSVDSRKYINKLPHEDDFIRWRAKISDYDYDNIVDELNNRIDNGDIHTAGWIPGNDWTGTVFEPIYHACKKNINLSGMFFGLIVFKSIMERTDCWGFGKYDKNGIPIQSMTYFKLSVCP